MVTFNEEKHMYQNVKTEDVYISATTLIHKYSNPFPKEFMSNYKALELIDPNFKKNKKVYLAKKEIDYLIQVLPSYINRKLLEEVAQQFIAQWDKTNLDSRVKGTAYHNKREAQAFDSKLATFADNEYSVQDYRDLLEGKTLDELLNIDYYKYLPDDYYPELRLFHHDYKIAGTSDVVLIETDKNGDRWASIEDFKTNKEIKMDNRYQNMLYPLTHYPDSNYHHYTLQISLYAYMLECMGFKIKHLRITWIDEFQNEIPYILEYKRQDVINMINHYVNNK